MFNSQLDWCRHLVNVGKSMSYYLSVIGSHAKVLPFAIIMMPILFLFYSCAALPVWDPRISTAVEHDCGVWLTCGLRK